MKIEWRRSSRCEASACIEVGFEERYLMNWFKSSKCEAHNCVEVNFQRSSKCQHADCVEIGASVDLVYVRDSKDGSIISFAPDSWSAFVSGLRNGEF